MSARRTPGSPSATNGAGLTCAVCGWKAKSGRTNDVKRHMREAHEQARPFKCNFAGCQTTCKQQAHLNTHLRKHYVEANGVRVGCPLCPHTFGSLDDSAVSRHFGKAHGEAWEWRKANKKEVADGVAAPPPHITGDVFALQRFMVKELNPLIKKADQEMRQQQKQQQQRAAPQTPPPVPVQNEQFPQLPAPNEQLRLFPAQHEHSQLLPAQRQQPQPFPAQIERPLNPAAPQQLPHRPAQDELYLPTPAQPEIDPTLDEPNPQFTAAPAEPLFAFDDPWNFGDPDLRGFWYDHENLPGFEEPQGAAPSEPQIDGVPGVEAATSQAPGSAPRSAADFARYGPGLMEEVERLGQADGSERSEPGSRATSSSDSFDWELWDRENSI